MGTPKEAAPSLLTVQLALLSELDPVLMAHAKRIDDENMAEIFFPDSKRVTEIARDLIESED